MARAEPEPKAETVARAVPKEGPSEFGLASHTVDDRASTSLVAQLRAPGQASVPASRRIGLRRGRVCNGFSSAAVQRKVQHVCLCGAIILFACIGILISWSMVLSGRKGALGDRTPRSIFWNRFFWLMGTGALLRGL